MSKLQFRFQDIDAEMQAFESISKHYIDQGCSDVLRNARQSLSSFRDQSTTASFKWNISKDNPLRTIVSKGEYEPGSGGSHEIYAEVSFVWDIRRIPPKKKSMRCELFELVGLASTRVKLVCAENGQDQIAMWRMEVGDSQSPGCFFHTQILGEDTRFPFPKSLPIPRFPAIILTPVTVAEFVLAELFQDDWSRHVSNRTSELDRLAPIQKKWMENILNWKLTTVRRSGSSPWSILKREKPAANLFTQHS